MQLTKDQVSAALNAGIAMTGPESDIVIPMKHASGALILNQLLMAIGSGQISLNTAVQDDGKAPPPPPGNRRPSKKVSKKRRQGKK